MNDSIFQQGYEVPAYLGGLRNYRSLVRQLHERAVSDEEHAAQLKAAASRHRQPLRATVMTEDWCGDAAANLPILARLFEAAGVESRVLRGSETPELERYYHDAGVTHIPVVSVWDAEWREIARWVEAPSVVDQKKIAWKQARPDFTRLEARRRQDKQAAKQFGRLYREFLDEMVGWYEAGDWNETTRELVDALR